MPDTTHQCPIDGCQAQVSYQHLMCPTHWSLVPLALRPAVYATWKKGRGAGTEAHNAACKAAIDAVHAKQREAGQ